MFVLLSLTEIKVRRTYLCILEEERVEAAKRVKTKTKTKTKVLEMHFEDKASSAVLLVAAAVAH